MRRITRLGGALAAIGPSVVGQSQSAAADALNSAGLTGTVTHVTTATGGCSLAALGAVIAASPAPGTFTAPPVNLTVCDIPPTFTLPTVTGLDDQTSPAGRPPPPGWGAPHPRS